MKIFNDITNLVGNTPLVKLNKIDFVQNRRIFAKLEFLNPTGSIKDRTALAMISAAEEKGILKKESNIIEATSGNTGIALAAICAIKGYNLTLTMPEAVSEERKKLLKFLGVKLILTSFNKGMQGAIKKAEELAKSISDSYIPQQFENLANPEMHRKTTAEEIWQDTEGEVDIVVAGIGTGGTITGIAQGIKEKKRDFRVIGVEPADFPHKIEGIGAGFVPSVLQTELIDETIKVKDKDAFGMMQRLAKEEGILAGVSSGATVWAVGQIVLRKEMENKLIVVILADGAERYLSERLAVSV
ncbi:MAG: cysteine synthase A [Candidatus Omnitrophica bacterium]|nr:cysteine synthase A [Candidatus Omnitrophota bacterium]